MGMEKLQELSDEVKKFEKDRRKPSEKLEEGMIGSKQLYTITKTVNVIAFIIFFVLWIKYNFTTGFVVALLIIIGERIIFLKSLMNKKRIREESARKKQERKKAIPKTNTKAAAKKDIEPKIERKASKPESVPESAKKKTFDPSKVIIKE